MADVSALEGDKLKEFISSVANKEVLFAQQCSCIVKNKHEACILALTRHRVIIYNIKHKKIEQSVNFLDIHNVSSQNSSSVAVECGKPVISVESTEVDSFIIQLFILLSLSFPSNRLNRFFKYKIIPDSREHKILTKYNEAVGARDDYSLVETFKPAYEALCDQSDIEPRSDIVWDIEKIYWIQNQKIFNIQDFDHLQSKQLLAIISTIQYIPWFKGICSKDKKLTVDVIQKLAMVSRGYQAITSLTLSGVGQLGDNIDVLAYATTNISHLDLSENGLDDKESVILSNIILKLPQLQSFNISGSSFTNKGLKMVCDALKQSCPMTLQHLTIDRCPNVKSDGWGSVGDALCFFTSLQTLSLAESTLSFDTLWTPLMQGCTANLRTLNLSKTKYTNSKTKVIESLNKLSRFIVTSQQLENINLSGCKLPPEAAAMLLASVSDNILLDAVNIDLSDNELGASGAAHLTPHIPPLYNVATLSLANNDLEGELLPLLAAFRKNRGIVDLDLANNLNKFKKHEALVQALISYISDPETMIRSLSIADWKLREHITPLLTALAADTKLLKLNISGNSCGNVGARALARSLTVNTTLRNVSFDNNQISLVGFRDLANAFSVNVTVQSVTMPYLDITACTKKDGQSEALIPYLNQITQSVQTNNAPQCSMADNSLLLQQHLLNSVENLQLDNAVVNLFDVLGNAVGKRDEQLQKSKNQALNLLKEAEQCSQLMHKLHDKADEERKRLYTCVAQGDLYNRTATKVVKVLDTELAGLANNYFDILKCALPLLLAPREYENSIASICTESCKVPYDSVMSILSNTFHQELSMTIGSCLLQAETKIISTVVASMVTRLNQLSTQIVEQLNIVKQTNIEETAAAEENQQEAEIDESIAHAQRRFTYTGPRKDRVKSNESVRDRVSSAGSKEKLCKPEVTERSPKPGKLPKPAKSMESVASIIESEKSSEVAEVDSLTSLTDSITSTKTSVAEDDEKEIKQELEISVASPERKEEETEVEEVEEKEVQKEEEVKDEDEADPATEPEEAKEEEVAVSENGMAEPIVEFDTTFEETAPLTHLTKARAKGPPKKKRRPPKNPVVVAGDPFQYSAGVTTTDMDTPTNGVAKEEEEAKPEPEVPVEEPKPEPPKKKVFRPPGHPMGGPMMPVMPMNELKGFFNKNKKPVEDKEEEEEETKPSSPEPAKEADTEVSPVKRKPFLGRPGPGMGGMGFPMGPGGGGDLMAQLKNKQKARVKTPDPDSEETSTTSLKETSLKESKSSPTPPPKPKPKPKGGVPLFPVAPKPDLRTKSIGNNKEKPESPSSPRHNSMPANVAKSGNS